MTLSPASPVTSTVSVTAAPTSVVCEETPVTTAGCVSTLNVSAGTAHGVVSPATSSVLAT